MLSKSSALLHFDLLFRVRAKGMAFWLMGRTGHHRHPMSMLSEHYLWTEKLGKTGVMKRTPEGNQGAAGILALLFNS